METLLLLVIVVAFVVILVELSLQYRERARARALGEEFIRLEECFQVYYRRYRTAPPPAGIPGEIPAGMEAQLHDTSWTSGSALGGRYQWLSPCPEVWAPRPDPRKEGPLGAIMLSAFAPEPPLSLSPGGLEEMKARVDEVPRLRGKLRTGFNGWPLLLVYPNP